MKAEPLVPYFEGRKKSFSKYPMNVIRFLILPIDFDKYVFENRGRDPQYFEDERDLWISGMIADQNSRFFDKIVNTFLCSSFDNILLSALKKNGIFNYQAFRNAIRTQVIEKYQEKDIDVKAFQMLLNELPQRLPGRKEPRGHYITKHSNAIYVLLEHIYEQTLLRVMPEIIDLKVNSRNSFFENIISALFPREMDNNGKPNTASDELLNWYKKHSIIKDCKLCGRKFRVVDLPSNYFFGSDSCKDCCFSCPVTLHPTKKELYKMIPNFVDECGFIPTANIGPTKYSFTSQLPDEKKIQVFRAYGQMGGIDHVKAKFGSWFNALAEVRVLPDGVQKTARGIRCVADDGHVCHSLAEQSIDNWLSNHKIQHDREPYYPAHPIFNKSGRRRADWKVGDNYIEYFGLAGDETYDKKTTEKIQLAKSVKINLISLYPSDLGNLEKKLGHL